MELIIVTGLSGAGKSRAMHCLEDLGYYCVDNMPPQLMPDFVRLARGGADGLQKVAFAIDTREARFFRAFLRTLDTFEKEGPGYRIMFLEASDAVLIRRYKETRRVHPMAPDGNIAEGIAKERKLLSDIKKRSSIVIDTSDLRPSELGPEIRKLLSVNVDSFSVTVMSFGYKFGVPAEADFVFDARFLPNPFYVKSLRSFTGNNKKVQRYVMRKGRAEEFMNDIAKIVESTIPGFMREGKYNTVVAIGCTGGRHRSVVIARGLADIFRARGRSVRLIRREK